MLKKILIVLLLSTVTTQAVSLTIRSAGILAGLVGTSTYAYLRLYAPPFFGMRSSGSDYVLELDEHGTEMPYTPSYPSPLKNFLAQAGIGTIAGYGTYRLLSRWFPLNIYQQAQKHIAKAAFIRSLPLQSTHEQLLMTEILALIHNTFLTDPTPLHTAVHQLLIDSEHLLQAYVYLSSLSPSDELDELKDIVSTRAYVQKLLGLSTLVRNKLQEHPQFIQEEPIYQQTKQRLLLKQTGLVTLGISTVAFVGYLIVQQISGDLGLSKKPF